MHPGNKQQLLQPKICQHPQGKGKLPVEVAFVETVATLLHDHCLLPEGAEEERRPVTGGEGLGKMRDLSEGRNGQATQLVRETSHSVVQKQARRCR